VGVFTNATPACPLGQASDGFQAECFVCIFSFSLLSKMLMIYVIEQAAPLLKLDDVHNLNVEIFVPAA